MDLRFDYKDISKQVGFYRKHQNIPEEWEVEAALKKANRGEIEGTIRLLDWSRHCFYVKTDQERLIMEHIFQYVKELFTSRSTYKS